MSMLTLERQNEIMKLLKTEKSVLVHDLAKRFFTGESTIRRDLARLEKKKLIKRTYGGAMLLEGLNTEIPLSVREREMSDAKNQIGRLAANLVEDGDCIILDSSTTVHTMLRFLHGKEDLIILTNGIKLAMDAGQELHCKIYCTGGILRENSSSLVGDTAQRFIQEHAIQKLFFSCRAISHTLEAMDVSDEEAVLRRTMIAHADKVYLLCDHSKLGKTAFNRICSLAEVDALLLDEPPAPPMEALLQQNGIHYLCSTTEKSN